MDLRSSELVYLDDSHACYCNKVVVEQAVISTCYLHDKTVRSSWCQGSWQLVAG